MRGDILDVDIHLELCFGASHFKDDVFVEGIFYESSTSGADRQLSQDPTFQGFVSRLGQASLASMTVLLISCSTCSSALCGWVGLGF